MMNRWIIGLAAGLLAGGAAAQDMLQIEAPPAWQGGWTLASDHGGAGWRFIAYKPANAPAKPKDFITITSAWGGSQKDGVTRLIGSWEAKVRGTCPNMTAIPPKPRSGNGFTVGYAQFYCPRRAGTNEGTADFVKAIASETTAHLVVVSRVTPPFTSVVPGHIQYEDEADHNALVEWLRNISDYLASVRACSGASPLEMKCSAP
jgi:hypothetical protein